MPPTNEQENLVDSNLASPVGDESSSKSITKDYKIKREVLYSEDIQDNIFQFTYRLVWSGDTERIQEFVRRNTNNPKLILNIPYGGGRVDPVEERNTGVKHVVISLCLEWENTEKQILLLMHECGHAVFTMMKLRSIQLPQNGDWKENDEECFLYYQQWIVKQCLDILNRPNKPWHLEEETPIE